MITVEKNTPRETWREDRSMIEIRSLVEMDFVVLLSVMASGVELGLTFS